MLIEIFKNNMGLITGFRHSWKQGCKAPIRKNIFFVPERQINGLIQYLIGTPCKVAENKEKKDKQCGDLFIHQLDSQDINNQSETLKQILLTS